MCDALAMTIIPKIPKKSIQQTPQRSESAAVPMQPTPPNFDLNAVDLFPIDDNDDILINFLNANPNIDQALQPVQQEHQNPRPSPLPSEINI